MTHLRGQALAAWPAVWRVGVDACAHLRPGRLSSPAPALQRGLLRGALEQLWGGWQDFGWVHLEAMRLAVCQGRVGTVVDLPHGLALSVDYARARLAARPPSGEAATDPGLPLLLVDELPVRVPGTTPLPESAWRLEVQPAPPPAAGTAASQELPWEVYVDAGAVGADLVLRRPRAGDRFQPLGMAGTKKLHDLFVDEKAPREFRSRLPVLAAGDRIVWVAGRWLADWARLRPRHRQAWRLRFLQGD